MATLGVQLAARAQAQPAETNSLGAQIVERLQTAAQLGGALGGVNAPLTLKRPPEGIKRFAREGVPLDTTTGMSFLKRAGLSFAPTPEDKVATLRGMFNGSVVEPAGEGNFIVRNVLDPATGQAKDLLIDEEQVTLKDVADLADAGVQTAAELLALKGLGRFTSGMGRLKRLGVEATTGTATAQAVAGATDTLNRVLEDQPLRMGETLGRRAREGTTQFGASMLLGGAVEGFGGLFDTATGRTTGMLAPGEMEKGGIAAIQRLNADLPEAERILPTIGQMAANPDVLRFETIMAKLPIVGRLFRAPLAQQDEALRILQRKRLGNEPLKPLNELGAETVETLKAAANQPEQAARMLETSVITRATDELETAMQKMAPNAQAFTTEGASALAKTSVRAQHKAFQQKANELFEAAGNPIIETGTMRKELARIQEDLPKKTVVLESELVDEAGRPLATTEGKAIVKELVPDKLNRLMRGLDQLDPQMPLSELRRIRSTIDSAITGGKGLEGVTDYELKQLREAVTRTIDDGIAALGDSDAAKKLARANKFYREGIDRFEEPLVAQMLKANPSDPGYIAPFKLLERLKADPDAYRSLERFMRTTVTEGGESVGPASSRQFDVLRRTLTEQMFTNARVPLGAVRKTEAVIDADAMLAELQALKPEVRASLLGAQAKVIDENLALLAQLKEGYKALPEEQLRLFLRKPNNSVQDLSQLATAIKREREVFANGLLKKFLKGDAEAGALPPAKTVDWLLHASNPSEVADVMAKLSDNPQLVEQLRRRFLAGVLQKTRAPLKSSAAASLNDASEVLDPPKLIALLKDDNKRAILRNVMGDEGYNFLRNFTEAQVLLGKHDEVTAGGFVATGALLNMLRNLPTVAKQVVFATAMTNRDLRQVIMEQSLKKALPTAEFTRLVLSSTPVLEALGDEFGKTGRELLLEGADAEP